MDAHIPFKKIQILIRSKTRLSCSKPRSWFISTALEIFDRSHPSRFHLAMLSPELLPLLFFWMKKCQNAAASVIIVLESLATSSDFFELGNLAYLLFFFFRHGQFGKIKLVVIGDCARCAQARALHWPVETLESTKQAGASSERIMNTIIIDWLRRLKGNQTVHQRYLSSGSKRNENGIYFLLQIFFFTTVIPAGSSKYKVSQIILEIKNSN